MNFVHNLNEVLNFLRMFFYCIYKLDHYNENTH